MSENEDLGSILDDSYKTRQKEIAIKTLGDRTYLSISKIAKLLEHKEHGATIGAITLDELLMAKNGVPSGIEATPASASASPRKTVKAKKVSRKTTTPKVKAKATAPASKKKKPRIVRDVAYKEVKAALKSLKGNCSNGDLVKATKYTPIQIRTFINEMIETGDVAYEGKGRGMKYSLA